MKPSRTSSAESVRLLAFSSAFPGIEGRAEGSPFESELGHHRRQLAPALALQFFGADRGHQVRLDGVMHRVWHRHSWLWPFFTVLAWLDIFFPETGHDVPASMLVTQTPQGVAWRRRFWFPRERRFNATMRYRRESPFPHAGEVQDGGYVTECVGPAGILEIPWDLRVHAPDRLEITTGRLKLRFGRLRVALPMPLQVTVRAVERAVDDAIEVELVLSHRLLDAIFGYDGTFAVRREPIAIPGTKPVARGLRRFAPWFYAAAVYNLLWGALAIFAPTLFFSALGMPTPYELAIWQALGMMVLVYAPAYWWIGNDPLRHRHLVVIAMFGKLLGPLGFLWAARTHALPLSFGLTILTNDLLWWPAFLAFLKQAAPVSGGWRNLLLGR